MKYGFSFTATSAMLPEFINVAQLVHDGQKIDEIDYSILGREKGVTNKRHFSELSRRIKALTPSQIEVLSEGSLDEQKQITHLALCKSYNLYKDFVTEVLYEKVLVFDTQLNDIDYNSFISKKKMDHPELDKLAETTQYKVRQVIYRMLYQIGMLNSDSNPSIIVPSLNIKVETVIKQDDSKWLKCFLQ